MTTRHRCLMIGAGTFATHWMRAFLPRFSDRLEVVALVDRDPVALVRGAEILDLPPSRQFTEMEAAFSSVDADFCLIAVTPAAHEDAVMRAVARNLPILSEKPIADTWDACLRIHRAVTGANVKMQVVQNYRYTPPLQAIADVLRNGSLGRPNYVVARFAQDYRELNSWGAPFRHQIPHALLVEGAVHHFDSIRLLSGGDCASMTGWEWNPAWSTSQGEFCNLFAMRMKNGTYASYEGNGTAAGGQYGWHGEAYRVECENGAVAVDQDRVVRVHQHHPGSGTTIHELPRVQLEYSGHQWIINEFLDWLDGGPVPATELNDNLKSVAMVFAAIKASQSGMPVDVTGMTDHGVEVAAP